jgi:hypothetical protein
LIAYKDVSLSARVMLGIEAVSVVAILVLGMIAMSKKGFATEQLTFTGLTADGLRTGLVLGIFSFVGFESASAWVAKRATVEKCATCRHSFHRDFGHLLCDYVAADGECICGCLQALNESSAPLHAMAIIGQVPALGTFCAALAMVSLFACALACTSAVARILMAMGRDGLIHISVGQRTPKNETPAHCGRCVGVLVVSGARAVHSFRPGFRRCLWLEWHHRDLRFPGGLHPDCGWCSRVFSEAS